MRFKIIDFIDGSDVEGAYRIVSANDIWDLLRGLFDPQVEKPVEIRFLENCVSVKMLDRVIDIVEYSTWR